MDDDNILARSDAQKSWDRARTTAMIEELRAAITGETTDLLPFDEVQQRLRLTNRTYIGLQEVPLADIRGSVGRYRDFTSSFAPRSDTLRQRWERVSAVAFTKGMDPVELYKVGEAYFVVDGNHRVSIARQAGMEGIEAHVWEFPTQVPLSADADYIELLQAQERAEFLACTQFDEIAPGHGIRFTELGRYREVLKHIVRYQDILAKIDEEPITFHQAGAAWYEMVYTPLIDIIRRRGLMERFPQYTESDLFIWIWSNHQYLKAYNRAGTIEDTTDLIDRPGWQRRIIQMYDKVMERLTSPAGDLSILNADDINPQEIAQKAQQEDDGLDPTG